MNFALILFILVLVTFIAWLGDRLVFRPRRQAAAAQALAQFDAQPSAPGQSDEIRSEEREGLKSRIERQPIWLEYTAGLFPVIFVVFLLRSFIAEPFKIPSESMLPTLFVGDLILVNKYTYGVRLPVVNTKVMDVGAPKRGDVMVFRYPPDPTVDYIKRVVAVPGDSIRYAEGRLTINGQPVPLSAAGEFEDRRRLVLYPKYSETLGEIPHNILTDLNKSSRIEPMGRFPHFDKCSYRGAGLECTVPPGHFFVMGDNRENSLDSRFWGFVPEENIVGKAFFIWMNFGDLGRIGRFH